MTRLTAHTPLRLTSVLAALMLFVGARARADHVVSNPEDNAPEAPVAHALDAALADSFDQYAATLHPSTIGTDQERSLRERYEWARFQKQFRWYLKATEPVTFVVTSVRIDGDDARRVFVRDLHHKDRMPVPVRVRRDGDTWKIVVNSL